MDIIWSSDHHPVLFHDWWLITQNLVTPPSEEPQTYDSLTLNQFKNLSLKSEWTQLSFYDLIEWMHENKTTYIITDVKERNLEFLEIIVHKYPQYLNRFIPQVYSFDEYELVSKMGFNRIIITLYKMPYSASEIFERITLMDTSKLFAVTSPPERLNSGLGISLEKSGIYVYAHTINDYETRLKLADIGVNGFYTDVFDVPLP